MKSICRFSVLAAALVAITTGAAAQALSAQTPITTQDMINLHSRVIGPAVTGSDPSTLYVASASGGLWKSVNRGQTWINVFDDMPVSTFGDVALAPSNPEIVYAGTGEQQNRQSTSYGNGIYRSDDGGGTWRHLGLEETRHIGRVRIHPSNPDVAYVAALGNLWAPSQQRGIFKTTDGGRSWQKVLYVDENTGAVDLVMDSSDPNTLYAATYQRQRRAWGFNGGGPGSGIYKTIDGGAHWNELEGGLPAGDKGRIGIAISESNPSVLNALIEHADRSLQGTYRTENGGLTWERVNALNGRPMYYSHIFIDPNDEDRVYELATDSNVSRDGGRTFSGIARRPTYDVGVHADQHTLWIDPNDSQHLYMGGDAGLHETYDGGVNFRRLNNFPIAQFYALGVDMRDPYWVYGGLQDNHSFMGPSQTRRWAGILNDDWMQSGFGDGMYWAADPRDARYSYGSSNGGNYFRFDTNTGDIVDVSPIEPPGENYRFDWTSPMMLSQHDPDVLYVAGNRFFTSRDRGSSWQRSEDLSRQIDRDDLEMMGVRGRDITISRNDGTGSFGEAVTLDESPVDARVLWVGFDDGNLQVSRDAGATWTEVSQNVRNIADGTYVSRITASLRSSGTAYAAFDGHRDGDFAPYLFRTEDFGASWQPMHASLPELGVVNVIVEHPDNTDVLFLGTEHHAFASTDGGANWAEIPNLPTTHYDDMLIHPRDKDGRHTSPRGVGRSRRSGHRLPRRSGDDPGLPQRHVLPWAGGIRGHQSGRWYRDHLQARRGQRSGHDDGHQLSWSHGARDGGPGLSRHASRQLGSAPLHPGACRELAALHESRAGAADRAAWTMGVTRSVHGHGERPRHQCVHTSGSTRRSGDAHYRRHVRVARALHAGRAGAHGRDPERLAPERLGWRRPGWASFARHTRREAVYRSAHGSAGLRRAQRWRRAAGNPVSPDGEPTRRGADCARIVRGGAGRPRPLSGTRIA